MLQYIPKMRLSIFILLALLTLAVSGSFRRITDYNQYLQKWKEIVPERYIHDVSHFSNDNELCDGKRCQYFYYEYEDQSFRDEAQRKNVLMVSGMHGNEYIGPHTLLYGYAHLKAYKIIYLPVANPSGFHKGIRQTNPGKIDPNRDYPIDGNTNCYRTTASHILDFLFRKYHFDLTLVLHNGGTQIGFNWGTFQHISKSHTADYDISIEIANMMKKVGGENERNGMTSFKVGTMDEAIFPVHGSFDDWAYAVGKFPQLITNCSGFKYEEYPKGMANGLVFLLELGPFNANNLGSEQAIQQDPFSKRSDNGFVSRGIRMLKGALNVIHPKLNIRFHNNTASVIVNGCRNAEITNFTIFVEFDGNSWSRIYQGHQVLRIKGDLQENGPSVTMLYLSKQVVEGDMIKYQGSMECDKQWNGKGTTSFASPRVFVLNNIQQVTFKKDPSLPEQLLQLVDIGLSWSDLKDYSLYFAILAILILCLLFFILFRRCCKKVKIQKFQEVEYVESQQHTDTREGEQQMQGDLHTARGGIVSM